MSVGHSGLQFPNHLLYFLWRFEIEKATIKEMTLSNSYSENLVLLVSSIEIMFTISMKNISTLRPENNNNNFVSISYNFYKKKT